MRLILALLFCISHAASAQQLLKVPQPVWAALAQAERDVIQQRYLVELASPETFGVIIDNQGIDESTPGTSGGANLGQAVANAAYIDRSFRDGNYSAKGQLGAILLGGLIGSALDAGPVSRFHYRYAVRTGDGSVRYVDEIGSSPFRHPVGICVNLPVISIAPDQQLCTQDLAGFRRSFLGGPSDVGARSNFESSTIPTSSASITSQSRDAPLSDLVDCKPNSLAPIRTTLEKSRLINGRVIQ